MRLSPVEPLGLPDGSVRAILAIMLVFGSLILFGIHRLDFDQLAKLDGAVLAVYFGQYISAPGTVPGVVPSPIPGADPTEGEPHA